MVVNIATIIILILIGLISVKYLKESICKYSNKAKDTTLSYIGDMTLRRNKINQQEVKLNPNEGFASTKTYHTIETMIRDLDLGSTTVEGYISFMFILSVIILVGSTFILNSFATAILITVGTMIIINSALFMISSDAYYTRCFAIMNAEDLITTSLKFGVSKAIQENIPLIQESVRDKYISFNSRISMGVSTIDSLIQLKTDLGYESHDYIDKLIQFEQLGSKGLLDIFQDNIEENSNKREDMLEIQIFMQDMNNNFIISLVIAGLMSAVVLMGNPLAQYYLFHTTVGNAIIIEIMFLIVFGFVKIQALRN